MNHVSVVAPVRRARVATPEREEMLLAGAIRIVAAEGFGISVRDLAARLDVPHSILFRHFPSKAALLKRIYDEVFASRLRPEWAALLGDTSLPIADRLLAFYRAYTAAIFDDTWVRIFLFAGLEGTSLNRDYFAVLKARILEPICVALRVEGAGAAAPASSAGELERAWGLHGRIFYLAVRRHVYRRAIPEPIDDVLTDAIAAFLGAARNADADRADAPLTDARPPAPAVEPPRPRRLDPELRRRRILEGAVTFFARRGLSGQMRELARDLGITHSLLFHYFPSKQDLLELVYEDVFERPWARTDRAVLHDRARSLEERLCAFYESYLAVVDSNAWIRIFISAGLHDSALCRRYLDRIENQVIDGVVAELTFLVGGGDRDRLRERAWGLHGQVVYRAIRNRIYELPTTTSPRSAVLDAVRCCLAGLDRVSTK